MALQRDFPARTGGTQTNAYILADITLDNKIKQGRLELAVWKDSDARTALKLKINNVCIPITILDQTVDENLCVTNLNWEDFAWKSGSDTYTKIKTLKVYTESQVIDMSTSSDLI